MYAFDRWLDAVIGAALALLMATIAPSAPLRKPRVLAAEVLADMGATLEEASRAMRAGDQDAADAVLAHSRRGEEVLNRFSTAASEGLAVVRQSPFRRGALPSVTAYADLYDPLDHASRNLRVLARRCAVSIWRDEKVPEPYLDVMDELAEVVSFMVIELKARRLPTKARDRLAERRPVQRARRAGRVDLRCGHPGSAPVHDGRPAGADRDHVRRRARPDPGDGLSGEAAHTPPPRADLIWLR